MLSGHNESISIELNQLNADTLKMEMEWFAYVLEARIAPYLPIYSPENKDKDLPAESIQTKRSWWFFEKKKETETGEADSIAAKTLALPEGKRMKVNTPDLRDNNSYYAQFVKKYGLVNDDRLVVMLTLAPHIQPQLLDQLLVFNKNTGTGHSSFGGIIGAKHGGFLPTIETALFLLADKNLDYRLLASVLFSPNHTLVEQNIIRIAPPPPNEPFQASSISLSEEALSQILYGKSWQPRFSTEFPAKPLTTPLLWKDLVVDAHTMDKIGIIDKWLEKNELLKENFPNLHQLKPGFKALFCGPPGTGKTLTAALLAKKHGLDVYRVDLSMVVSKYIGETEKNLEKIFAMAESQRNWILFFDEADALFGKRTSISDAHDKYANQEIAYLLQRLEEYPGLVILASNMQHNIDEAFARRMQAIVNFPKPAEEERKQLWRKALEIAGLEDYALPYIDMLSQRFNLTGAGIMNVVYYATLERLAGSTAEVNRTELDEEQFKANQNQIFQYLYQGIRHEYHKEGRNV